MQCYKSELKRAFKDIVMSKEYGKSSAIINCIWQNYNVCIEDGAKGFKSDRELSRIYKDSMSYFKKLRLLRNRLIHPKCVVEIKDGFARISSDEMEIIENCINALSIYIDS